MVTIDKLYISVVAYFYKLYFNFWHNDINEQSLYV